MPSYVLAPDGKAITCTVCGMTSHNVNDITYHYCGACGCFHDDVATISMWVIYDRPTDYPDSYVLRQHVTVFTPNVEPREFAETACRVSGEVAELRAFIPRGAINLGRSPGDDAKILEVWIA